MIRDIDSPSLPSRGNYTRASVAQFYKQTIANIIIRDLDLFNKLIVFTDDNSCDDIVLNFNNTDTVVIKTNGNYSPENINLFSNLAYKYAGYFDLYHISAISNINEVNGRKIATVEFMITDNFIKPMIFK